MSGPTDVVIAGTKPFALALFAPVTERAGTRPRIAPEPATALTLCAESSGVLVVEYEPRWLPALTTLRQSRPGLRVVAALPLGQEDAALQLEPLSIDAVPWDGKAISVLPAIERAISNGAVEVPEAAPSGQPAPLDLFKDLGATAATTPSPASLAAVKVPTGLPPAGSGPGLDLFRDLGAVHAAAPVPAAAPAPAAPPAPIVKVRSADAAWPANGPSAPEAEQALRDALAGAADASTLGAVAGRAASDLSPFEREAFAGADMAVDAGLIRRAAVLRLRVAVALATRPPKGTVSDNEAVAELLSEIDGVLASVKGLLDEAPPETKAAAGGDPQRAGERGGRLLRGLPRGGDGRAPADVGASVRAAAGPPRVLSVHAGTDAEDRPEERRRRVAPVITLVIVLLLGGGVPRLELLTGAAQAAAGHLRGGAGRDHGGANGQRTSWSRCRGQKVDPAELERYRQHEAKRGNQVREVGPGTWIIEPARPEGEARHEEEFSKQVAGLHADRADDRGGHHRLLASVAMPQFQRSQVRAADRRAAHHPGRHRREPSTTRCPTCRRSRPRTPSAGIGDDRIGDFNPAGPATTQAAA